MTATANCPKCSDSYDKHYMLRQPDGDCPLCAERGQRCELVKGAMTEYLQWAIRQDAREAVPVDG